MKKSLLVIVTIAVIGCKGNDDPQETQGVSRDSTFVDEAVAMLEPSKAVPLTVEEANRLGQLPLDCINVEYPNKLNQTLAGSGDIGEPKELHPAFYGCFDWHSSVHAHWTLVNLLKKFPEMKRADEIREKLKSSLTAENIREEVQYFSREQESSFERTYGWAWVLKLAEELHTWEDPLAEELRQNLQPLTDLMVQKFKEFLPKLNHPIRVGEHTNTAFALALAHDYAVTSKKEELRMLIEKRAKDYFLNDDNCPIEWEPSGFDFLSPCLAEVDIMRRVLPKQAFRLWMKDFMPQLRNKDFMMEVAEVTDRTDGKLVHLDGLNFSRAWVFYGLANQYPEEYGHLRALANDHVSQSFPNLVGDSYEGGHWLGTFALYAIQESNKEL